MNKISESNMFKFKNQKSIFMKQYRISQQISQIFEISGLCCFGLTALAIDKTFTLHKFLPNKIEIVSTYFPIKI